MNRWMSMLVSVLVISVMVYTTAQIYELAQSRYQAMEDKQSELAQQVSDLNDRMVAVSRDTKLTAPDDSTDIAPVDQSIPQVLPRHWLSQTLKLAQAQLEQAQTQFASDAAPFRAAKETLNLVKSNLNALVESQTITELSASALTRAIDTDLQMLDDEAKVEYQDIQLLDRQIAQLQFNLGQMAQKGPTIHASVAPSHSSTQSDNQPSVDLSFMQRIRQLLIIEKPAQDVRSNMLQRSLICREVSLTLGLARKGLAQAQWDQVIELLADSRTQLTGLVDVDAKKMQASIANLTVKPHTKLQITALKWLPADIASLEVKLIDTSNVTLDVTLNKPTTQNNIEQPQTRVLSRLVAS